MQWLELTIHTTSAGIDAVCGRLEMLGYEDLIIDDEADFQDFLANNRQYWDYVDEELAEKMKGVSQIRLYLEDNDEAPAAVSAIDAGMRQLRADCPQLALGTLEIGVAKMADEDWENNWKQFYKPIPIGERLLVVPQWMQEIDTNGRIPVILDPGMIFGTGAHASTQMCMKELERHIHGGERVIDLGSGSGILSITALLLGAASAIGVDIDPKAEDIARENAAMNALTLDRFNAITGDVIGDRGVMEKLAEGGYDVVLANIVADVIIPLSTVVPHFLRDGAPFICSGILATRADEVIAAIERAGMRIVGRDQIDDWCRLTAVKA